MPPRRRRVLIVAFPGAQTLDVAGPGEVFALASRFGGAPHYEVIVVSARGGSLSTTSGMRLGSQRLRGLRVGPRDTVLAAGGPEAAIRDAVADAELLAFLRLAARRAERIGSVCSGAFLLAAAGILDGRRAATHWSACARLAAFRPAVTVDGDAIFITDGRVWTSAGVTTGIDMALAIVERDHGRELADAIAAQLVLYVRRPGFQSQWSDALVAQTEAPLAQAVAWTRAHLGASLEQVARHAGMSLRTFHRRCLAHLRLTPAKLLDRLRVDHARTLLATTALPAKQIAGKSGFASQARMTAAFRRALGVLPSTYRTMTGR